MKRIEETGIVAVTFEADDLRAPEARRADFLVTSVRVQANFGHDRVTVWNRGANSGTLTVGEGDGEKIAARLLSDMLPQLAAACAAFDESPRDARPETVAALRERIFQCALMWARGLQP